MMPASTNFVLCIVFAALVCGCAQSGAEEELPFTIKGKLENHASEKNIFLSALSGDEFVPQDTAAITAEGEFLFEGKINGPDLYRISLSDGSGFVIVIDAPNIELRADARDLRNYVVTGSGESRLLKALLQAEDEYVRAVSALERKFVLARDAGHNDSLVYFQEKYQEIQSEYAAAKKDFIREHPDSFVASYATYAMLGDGGDEAFVDSILVAFNREIPHSKYVQLLNERRKSASAVVVGAVAPEITLPQQDGTPLTLSSLRGQFVLIDFWASWCRPCREENPEMVKLYQQYHDKGFEILGVSLDESRDQWTQAINKDGLPWSHVSDLKGTGSVAVQLYNVQAIPMTVLLDGDGKVIALNLRGEALSEKLGEIFKGKP